MTTHSDDDSSVLEEARQAGYGYSAQASDNARRLCFVGYGLIALFGGLGQSSFTWPLTIPNRLVWAGLLLTLTLAADLLQYVYGSAAWMLWSRHVEKSVRRGQRPAPTEFPAEINWASNAFFWLKILFVVIGWLLLLIHLADNVRTP